MPGKLLTFEGIDGSGKSTQAARSLDYLHSRGVDSVLLREPGGTVIGERIRHLLLDVSHKEMAPLTELFLYLAARSQITSEIIRPHLDNGISVVMDRYYDSTTAYQGFARGLGHEAVAGLNRIATECLSPDMTIVFDCPVETAFSRMNSAHDRLESEGIEFMRRVRDGFRSIGEMDPGRVVVVDGSRPADSVFEDVRRMLDSLYGW